MKFKSVFLQEIASRGYLNQLTDESDLDNLLSQDKVIAYIGFDCTAKSLHVGSLMQIMVLRYLQKSGHQPIVLLGDGTTRVGDPSGKDESRQLLDNDAISQNLHGIKSVLEKFDLSKENPQFLPFQFVQNNDWLAHLNYIDFLRDFGRHFSINRMLSFDSVKLRLDRKQSLSFLEFNYMILQAYDFYELNKRYNCSLQIGGSDQWGNIINGVELVRRYQSQLSNDPDKKSVYGLTTPLLTNSEGNKMGKTAKGAVWLDKEMLDEFEYFQYFRNVDDADVARFLRFFTELDLEEINKIENLDINAQKKILAFQATKICHGDDLAKECQDRAEKIFAKGADNIDDLPEIRVDFSQDDLANGKELVRILKEHNLCTSIGEAKRLIKGGAVKINDNKIIDEFYLLNCQEALESFKLSLGKKRFFKIILNKNV